MNADVAKALATERTIDITTTGSKSGAPSRIEIWFHNVDDRIYITGMPGKRDWYANLLAEPKLTFHLKESVTADLEATGRPVSGGSKRAILETILERLGRADEIDEWMDRSPLVEVRFA